MTDGIISVYKEPGYTSHDVVAKLRGILGQKKIGHTGTLDPEAQGVLPVCLGSATKVCGLLADWDKTYRTVLLLGRTTDTQDTTGAVLKEREVSCTEAEIRSCIQSFEGEIWQVPPMYSARKVNGKKLCDLARAGIEVERQARPIFLYGIQILEIALPSVRMDVRCSKGTYIRTLCHDIGERLGCGGCMASLTRLAVGPFRAEESVTLAEIERLRDEGRLQEVVRGTDSVFQDFPALPMREEGERLLANGNPLRPDFVQESVPPADGQRYRVYRRDGSFAAVYRWRAEREMYWPEKIFL